MRYSNVDDSKGSWRAGSRGQGLLDAPHGTGLEEVGAMVMGTDVYGGMEIFLQE